MKSFKEIFESVKKRMGEDAIIIPQTDPRVTANIPNPEAAGLDTDQVLGPYDPNAGIMTPTDNRLPCKKKKKKEEEQKTKKFGDVEVLDDPGGPLIRSILGFAKK